MGGEHDHGAGLVRAGERHRGRLRIAFALILVVLLVEVVAGFATNSLALLSDAGHMLTDVIGLGMALAAIQMASRFESSRSSNPSHLTFGLYRLEVLAAFVNALLLGAVALWVVSEALRRIGEDPEVLGGPMLAVALLGLAANIAAFALLRPGAQESINVEGAYLEVLADTVGSIGVIVAAVIVQFVGWTWIDAVVAAAIGVWILPRTLRLGRRAARILLQAAPEHLDLAALTRDLAAIDGVRDVHDVHVWTLTSEMDAASAHLAIGDDAGSSSVLDAARHVLEHRYGIRHATVQVEPEGSDGCSDLTW